MLLNLLAFPPKALWKHYVSPIIQLTLNFLFFAIEVILTSARSSAQNVTLLCEEIGGKGVSGGFSPDQTLWANYLLPFFAKCIGFPRSTFTPWGHLDYNIMPFLINSKWTSFLLFPPLMAEINCFKRPTK